MIRCTLAVLVLLSAFVVLPGCGSCALEREAADALVDVVDVITDQNEEFLDGSELDADVAAAHRARNAAARDLARQLAGQFEDE